MATGGKKKEETSNSALLGGILGGIAGVALGGLALYGLVKSRETKEGEAVVHQQVEAKKGTDMTDACQVNDYDKEEKASMYDEHHSKPYTSNFPEAENPPASYAWPAEEIPGTTTTGTSSHDGKFQDPSLNPCSLLDQLNIYLNNYVSIKEAEEEEALKALATAEKCLKSVLEVNLPLGGFVHAGSGFDGTQVIKPDKFDILISLDLDKEIWKFVDCRESACQTPGYFLVKRVGWDMCRFSRDQFDKFLEGQYLSFKKILKYFYDILTSNVDEIHGKTVTCTPRFDGKTLSVIVEYPVFFALQQIKVDLIPVIFKDDVSVIGKVVQDTNHMNDLCLWPQNFSWHEFGIFKSFDEDGGCQKDCLKILKAICRNDPYLKRVDSYQLKTILMHLSFEEEFWEQETLAERVIDMLNKLKDYLEQGKLPNYFKPSANLLLNINDSDAFRKHLVAYITEVMDSNRIPSLLKQEYIGGRFTA